MSTAPQLPTPPPPPTPSVDGTFLFAVAACVLSTVGVLGTLLILLTHPAGEAATLVTCFLGGLVTVLGTLKSVQNGQAIQHTHVCVEMRNAALQGRAARLEEVNAAQLEHIVSLRRQVLELKALSQLAVAGVEETRQAVAALPAAPAADPRETFVPGQPARGSQS